MTTQQAKERILIATFLGMQKTDIGWYDFNELLECDYEQVGGNTFDIGQLNFDTDWNLLMVVVDEIESYPMYPVTENVFCVKIGPTNYCTIFDAFGEKTEIIGNQLSRIESVYQACLEFIKRVEDDK